MKRLGIILWGLVGIAPAFSMDCDKDTLRDKSQDGDVLIMASGHIYKVLPGDEIDSALWLPADEILVCDAPLMMDGKRYVIYDIINLSEHGEKIGARLLK